MTEYWVEHSQDASLEEMMLDTQAEEVNRLELPEILSYLPPYEGYRILELGSGIGRFTGKLAELGKEVVAVDFMEKFVEKNKEVNGHHNNITFMCADVTKLELEEKSFDLIFSNWLMMYLEDEEVQALLKKQLSWLKKGGYLFARESCNHQSGDRKRTKNPTKYRDSHQYDAFYAATTIPSAKENKCCGFDLVLNRPSQTYVKLKHNRNQVIWLLQKNLRTNANNHGYKTVQEFLDNHQYSEKGILRYEKIYGSTFVSTGGQDTTKEFVSKLDLKKDQVVLDVGCGIGGSAFYMAKEFGVKVVGIDLSTNMVNIGLKRAKDVAVSEEQVQFEIADVTKRDYTPAMFDVIYSRDTILHIPEKLTLFKRFFKWLKPGGKLLISDYCCSPGDHSDQFKSYVKQRGYTLLSPVKYGNVLKEAGFCNVQADDRTDLFVACLQKELERITSIREEFIKEFSLEDYDYLVTGWKDKVERSGQGDQRWGVFYAEKP
ncbi:hypothetical protein ACJMK2_009885 [Sinanodonta woodiana]|uniref:phosphoethanolamine N-methyltransferase n=1 Tax=Sinanodonta woodiana TaxID=1069815 RepID=A0ABD3VDN9_SINWO